MGAAQARLASRKPSLEPAPTGMQPYWISIFLGAFLLFAIQLLLGKYFLPWFGGTPAMWTTCMFFFQMLLLAGYAYAHALANWFSLRVQGLLHSVAFALRAGIACFPGSGLGYAGHSDG